MVMLPGSFPDRLVPLAWLAGRWQGFGTIVTCESNDAGGFVTDSKPQYVVFECTYVPAADGAALVETRKAFHAHMAGDGPAVSVTQSAAAGLDALVVSDLWWEETTTWNVEDFTVSDGTSPASTVLQGVSSGCVSLLDAPHGSADHSVVWRGQSSGPRVSLTSVVTEAVPVEHIERNYGLVGGELMVVQDLYVGSHTVSEWCCRMEKVSVSPDV